MYYWFTCHFYKLLLTSTHLLIQCIYFFYNHCLYQNRVENGLQSFDDTVLCTAPFHVHTVYRHTAASSVQVESLLSLICHIFRKWIVADKWKWMCSFVYLSFLASSRAWLHGRTRSREVMIVKGIELSCSYCVCQLILSLKSTFYMLHERNCLMWMVFSIWWSYHSLYRHFLNELWPSMLTSSKVFSSFAKFCDVIAILLLWHICVITFMLLDVGKFDQFMLAIHFDFLLCCTNRWTP